MPRGQGAPVEAFLAVLAADTCRVVQASQAATRQGVTVAHSVGVHVSTALTWLAGLGGPREPQWVPEKAIITDLTAPPWESRRLVWRSRNEGPGLLSPRAVRVGGNPRELPRGSWWSRAWAPGLG